jgi:hypothetical protein
VSVKVGEEQCMSKSTTELVDWLYECARYLEFLPEDAPEISGLLNQHSAKNARIIAFRLSNLERVLKMVLNSDMAMREEDEGGSSEILKACRDALGRKQCNDS